MTEPTQQAPKTKWRVTGTKIDSGEPATLYIEARSAESAQRLAEKNGIGVAAVEPLVAPIPYQSAEPDLHSVYLETVRPGAAFSFGFYAFLGGIVAWIIVGGFIALILSLLTAFRH